MVKWLPICICILANICANLALKRAVIAAGAPLSWPKLPTLLSVPWFWLGIVCLAIVFISYLLAIRNMPVGLAYSLVTSVVAVGTLTIGVAFLGETLSVRSMAGITAVIGGVLLISTG
jgi:multidrug transporter EmrE-like cation transporter